MISIALASFKPARLEVRLQWIEPRAVCEVPAVA